MSKTKKALATALVTVAAAAAPAASVALASGTTGVHLACQGGGSGGCSQ
jgi:hypothetical protein